MLGPDLETVENRLLSLILETRRKTPEETAVIGGNLATLLVRCNPLVFKGQDISQTNVSHASFYNADLTGTVLAGANLQRASFDNTTLDDADFRTADLTDAKFDEMGAVHSIAFSEDGKRLASGGTDSNVHIWNVTTGEELLTMRGHKDPVTSVSWSRNDQFIASGSADQSVILWNSQTGERFRRVDNIFPNWVTGVSFSPKGDELAIVGGLGSGGIKLWNWLTGEEPKLLFQYPAQTNHVCYSHDGKALASSVWDRGYVSQRLKVQVKNALLVDMQCLEPTIIKSDFKEGTWGIAFAPDGKRLFIGDFNGDIFIFSVEHKKMFSRIFQQHPLDKRRIDRRVHAIAINSKYQLVAGYSGGKITIWNIENLAPLLQLDVFPTTELIEERLTPGGRGDIAFDPSGTVLAGGFEDKSIRFWDARPFIPAGLSLESNTHSESLEGQARGATHSESQRMQTQRTKVPSGLTPNPNFGKCFLVIEQKLSCKGLQVNGAKGLNAKLSADQKIFMEKGINTLGQWLVARGASWFQEQAGKTRAKEWKSTRG